MSQKHDYIHQPGWLRRVVGTVHTRVYPDEPCVCIPISWLGEDYAPDNPYTTDPAILAAKIRGYDALHAVHTSVSVESLHRTLEQRRAEKEEEEA